MKTLKMFKAVFLMLILAILTGCSDQITSSGETGSSEKGEGVIVSETLPIGLPVVLTFRTQIRLKPYRSFIFNNLTTGFDRLYSIDVTDLSVKTSDDQFNSDCNNILVYSNPDGNRLSCHSNGFELKQIVVENTSSQFLDLDVSIRGIKQKKDIKVW